MVPRSWVKCLLHFSLSSSKTWPQIQTHLEETHSRAGKLKAQFSGYWAGKGGPQEDKKYQKDHREKETQESNLIKLYINS